MVDSVFVVIEYNWNRVGGIFYSKKEAQKWCRRAHKIEPNLMWEIKPFQMDIGLSDEVIISEYKDR